MRKATQFKRIAIIGGGPSGLFMYKRLIESNQELSITVFEKKKVLGVGMPYGDEGANLEHITNVSENEIPTLVTSIEEWSKTLAPEILNKFNIDIANFNSYKVLPRLFFGAYLEAQFLLLQDKANDLGLNSLICLESEVIDVMDQPKNKETWIKLSNETILKFDHVIICSGHNWPKTYEGMVDGYFDSPYPPAKLAKSLNHSIAIRGSSLTAIDAIRTLARSNGNYSRDKNGDLIFNKDENKPFFKMIMHSRSGLLPAVRFHLEDSHLKNEELLTEDEIALHRIQNDGFVSLDYIFDKNFKSQFITKDLDFYHKIKELNLEGFVALMMEQRAQISPFQLLKAEYKEAEKSIKRHQSVYWKELLGSLSFTLNYPAKYFSAEDMMRLKKELMPLISIIIAYLPQGSCEELLALYEAGVLDLITVGEDSKIEVHENGEITYYYKDENEKNIKTNYQTFINCVGQPHLNLMDFPFKSLIEDQTLSTAKLKFKSINCGEKLHSNNDDILKTENGDYYLKISGIGINDDYQVVDNYGSYNERIYIMAVPYIGGYNPDYSGLDFCEQASTRIINSLVRI